MFSHFLDFWRAIPSLDALPSTLHYLLVMALGSVLGSFLNVVVYRLPRGLEYADSPSLLILAWPCSHCPQCAHTLRFWENIPLLSYIVLRGRCTACHAPIRLRYPFLEITGACLAGLVLWNFGATWQGIAAFSFLAALLALACIDQEHYLLPDTLTLPLLWAGLLVNIPCGFAPLEEAVLGAAAGYVSLWCVYWIFLFIRKKEGLGYGDFKLLAAIGAWQGVQALPQILLLASCMGLVIGLFQRRASKHLKHKEAVRLAFGPFLSVSAAITLFVHTWFMAPFFL